MAKVDTNTIGLKFADEADTGTQPPDGYVQSEPNEIGNFGAAITTTPRAPISVNRQRQRGAVTDLEAAVGFTEDLTFSAFRAWAEAALFAKAKNAEVSDIKPSAVAAGANPGYTVLASAARAALLNYDAQDGASLLWADGFGQPANNGLKVLAADLAAAGVSIRVVGAAVEAAATGYLSLAGWRVPAGTDKTFAWSAADKTLALTVADIGTGDRAGANLVPGMLVHIGSVASAGGPLQNGARDGDGAVPRYGYARVKSIPDDDSIVFDKVDPALQANFGANDAEVLDLVYGEFIRNVATTADEFLRRSRTLELESPGLGDVVAQASAAANAGAGVVVDSIADLAVGDHIELNGARHRISAINAGNRTLTLQPVTAAAVVVGDGVRKIDDYEYAVGMLVNTLTLNLPLTDKATMALAMIGTDVKSPGQQAGRAGNSGAARAGDVAPRKTSAFNTTADFARLRVTGEDEDSLTTDFKSLTVTLNNNLTGEKVLAFLGNKFVNLGNLAVDLEAQVIFSTPRVPRAIRDNTVLRADAIIANDDGVIGIDIPSLTLGGGGREYPVNQAVLVNTTIEAFGDDDLDTSIGVSIIPVPIPTE